MRMGEAWCDAGEFTTATARTTLADSRRSLSPKHHWLEFRNAKVLGRKTAQRLQAVDAKVSLRAWSTTRRPFGSRPSLGPCRLRPVADSPGRREAD